MVRTELRLDWLISSFVFAFADLDADSQNEAPNAVLSGLESESESDPAEPVQEDNMEQECEETTYVPFTEEEFGEVSGRKPKS